MLKFKKDPQKLIHPKKANERDCWDNVTKSTNALGDSTEYDYNHRNQQILQRSPEVDVYHEDGSVTREQPTTITGHNARGFKIGVQNPNGNTRAYVVNEANQSLKDILGDGTIARTRSFDIFGRVPFSWDARGKRWSNIFNCNNKVIMQKFPSGKHSEFGYNERGHQNLAVDPRFQETTPKIRRYNFDPMQNVQTRFEPLGQWCNFNWDLNHQLTSQNYSDGMGMSWQRDFFGVPARHTDLSGTEYTYIYDLKRQLVSESCPGGTHGNSCFMQPTVNDFGIYSYNPIYQTTPGKNIGYRYRVGLLIEENDYARGQLVQYDWDAENHRTDEQLFTGGTRIRALKSAVDELSRQKMTYDSGLTIITGYDANDNRRFTVLG